MYIWLAVYQTRRYMDVIGEQAQSCIVAAVEEVKKLPLYETKKGDVMTYTACVLKCAICV